MIRGEIYGNQDNEIELLILSWKVCNTFNMSLGKCLNCTKDMYEGIVWNVVWMKYLELLLQLVFGTGKFLPCINLMNWNVFNQSFHETSWTKMFLTNATMKPHKPKCLSISVTPNLMNQNIFPAMLIQTKQSKLPFYQCYHEHHEPKYMSTNAIIKYAQLFHTLLLE